MLLQDAAAFVATTAFDRRLKVLQQHCITASVGTPPVKGIHQALQELRLQVHRNNKLQPARIIARSLKSRWHLVPCVTLSCLAQVSSCCGATIKLDAEQRRLARLLSATDNAAETAEAKCDALAAEIALHHKMLCRGRVQQENSHVSRSNHRSKQWRNVNSSMHREV